MGKSTPSIPAPKRATIQEGENQATGLCNTCESHNMTNKKNHFLKNHDIWFHVHRISVHGLWPHYFRVRGKTNASWEASMNGDRWTPSYWKRKEEEGLWSLFVLQGHSPKDLTHFHQTPLTNYYQWSQQAENQACGFAWGKLQVQIISLSNPVLKHVAILPFSHFSLCSPVLIELIIRKHVIFDFVSKIFLSFFFSWDRASCIPG